MKNPYPYEKFYLAVRGMAASPRSIQERIADAYLFNLIHVRTEDLPETIRWRFNTLRDRLTSVEPERDEGTVMATVNKMSTSEAVEIADEILSLADEVNADYLRDS